jgi:hypothetical protein
MDSPGHRALRQWFERQPHLVRAHEAETMGMSKQQLGHILAGRRRPTLRQALAIDLHTAVPVDAWEERARR